MQALLGIAIRASVMYVAALLLMRISGKRSLGKISPLDFIVITLIGDLFGSIFWGKVSLPKGLVGFITLIALHMIVSYAGWRWPKFDRLICSTPRLVITNGAFVTANLAAERTSHNEVLSELRRYGEDAPNEIKEAHWEPDGRLSVFKHSPSQAAQKRDLVE